ncbi:MAG: tRNA uridine-5-carboxymethylaminomethyl(34) synthesis GTPase MnmE [Bacteroidota bacterium]|jgi:tRNA modification GTPase
MESPLSRSEHTIAAIATAPGVGAIAVIRVSGKDAFAICDRVFQSGKGKTLALAQSHSALFGTIRESDEVVDEVLALVLKGPRSFTGEDTVEFSCHGSTYIQQRILDLLIRNGARSAEPGEFTLRAFMNGKMDLTEAEAVADVIAADSSGSHRLAINQMRGGFSNEIQLLREKLIEFASLLELELDFSEEDVEFADRTRLIQLLDEASLRMQSLSASFESGNVIKSGIPVALTGKPNTGKSTLLNLILNEERAIVSDIAGTTRDTIEEEIVINGIKYRFIDTAGIRNATDEIERIGVGRSFDKMREASIIIYLFDPSETNPEELKVILNEIRNSKGDSPHIMIPTANKSDRYNTDFLKKEYEVVGDVIFISAKNHIGINELMEWIGSFTTENLSSQNQTILTNIRHKESIDKTHAALQNARNGLVNGLATDLVAIDIRTALMHLGEISGAITTDDLLESIFSKFCIGK